MPDRRLQQNPDRHSCLLQISAELLLFAQKFHCIEINSIGFPRGEVAHHNAAGCGILRENPVDGVFAPVLFPLETVIFCITGFLSVCVIVDEIDVSGAAFHFEIQLEFASAFDRELVGIEAVAAFCHDPDAVFTIGCACRFQIAGSAPEGRFSIISELFKGAVFEVGVRFQILNSADEFHFVKERSAVLAAVKVPQADSACDCISRDSSLEHASLPILLGICPEERP